MFFISRGSNRGERDDFDRHAEPDPGSLQDGVDADPEEGQVHEVRATYSGGKRTKAFWSGLLLYSDKLVRLEAVFLDYWNLSESSYLFHIPV